MNSGAYHHHHCLDTYDIPFNGQIAAFSLVQSWQSPALLGETPGFASEHLGAFVNFNCHLCS